MSKKLIAVASAAALALSALVGVAPASADVGASFHGLAADGSANDSGLTMSATAAAEAAANANLTVPAGNFLIHTNTTARTVIKVKVTTSVGTVVTASSTGSLKIVSVDDADMGSDYKLENAADVDWTSTAGVQSLTKTATTDNVSFYVFTTSTNVDSLTINKSGNTRVVYIKGGEGVAYNISAALPTTVPISVPDDHNVIVKVTDVFGNTVKAATTVAQTLTGAGLTLDGSTTAGNLSLTYDSTEGGHGFKMHTTASGSFAVNLSITATDVTGLPAAKKSVFLTSNAVSIGGLSAQITTLTAQVAALTAQLAESRPKATSVTKKKYNTLARKWNAANPGARVALKK